MQESHFGVKNWRTRDQKIAYAMAYVSEMLQNEWIMEGIREILAEDLGKERASTFTAKKLLNIPLWFYRGSPPHAAGVYKPRQKMVYIADMNFLTIDTTVFHEVVHAWFDVMGYNTLVSFERQEILVRRCEAVYTVRRYPVDNLRIFLLVSSCFDEE